MKTPVTKTLMTKTQVAELLNVSTRTIDRFRSAGLDLGEVRFGSKRNSSIRFKRDVIQKLADAGFKTA